MTIRDGPKSGDVFFASVAVGLARLAGPASATAVEGCASYAFRPMRWKASFSDAGAPVSARQKGFAGHAFRDNFRRRAAAGRKRAGRKRSIRNILARHAGGR
jgi:hypothetical protein